MNVAVIGASDDPGKYSNKALRLLIEQGHRVFPVHPTLTRVEGLQVYGSIEAVPEPVHTVSLYVSPQVSSKLGPQILAKKPRRILFNPGAENETLEAEAARQGIQALRACTIVLLTTGQFERGASG